ncbi:MAG: alpha/beta hydrolase [Pseudomonadota bacterium]
MSTTPLTGQLEDLFPGFHSTEMATDGPSIFCRYGGQGPPLILLHGYPQSHAMWHRIAPALAERFTVVLPDLRGYGRSGVPANTADNEPYSKRAMARDILAVADHFAFHRFQLVGHDRGARVAYRFALDHPSRLQSLTCLDIVPTFDMWERFTVDMAMATYHWLFLAQPEPLPEMMIGAHAEGFIDYTLASWTGTKSLDAFHPTALADYRKAFSDPARIAATCHDYRAGQTMDYAIDRADREAKRRIEVPLLSVWGETGIPSKGAAPLTVWREWANHVEGHGVPSGHFIPEENPDALMAHLLPFLERHL